MFRYQAFWCNKDKVGDSNTGEMHSKGVHPEVVWHDGVSNSDVT